MLDLEHMRFFIDPCVDQTVDQKSLYVLETYRKQNEESMIGTVVTLKDERYSANGRTWWTTENGDYVFGAPSHDGTMNTNTPSGVIAQVDDMFAFGHRYENQQSGTGVVLMNPIMSRPVANFTQDNWSPTRISVPVCYRAAPWADELMPRAVDTDDVIMAKLELAQEKFRQRRAFNRLHEESLGRGWEGNMEELMEASSLMPKAQFGTFVTASVFIPASSSDIGTMGGAAVQQSVEARAQSSTSSNVKITGGVFQLGGVVNASFKARGVFTSADLARNVPLDTLSNEFNRANSFSGGVVVNAARSPRIRSLS